MNRYAQNFKLGYWADIIEYICNPNNNFLYLGMISKDMDIYYAQLYNVIMDLQDIGLIKTKKVGNIRKIVNISKECYGISKSIKQIREVFKNANKKNTRTSTNRKTKTK